MKKIVISLLLLCGLAMFMAVPAVQASDVNTYTVAVDTYVPTIEDLSASWPNIDGPARIGEIIIANSGDTVQTVTLYELSESSLTASAIAVAVSPTTGTISIDLEGAPYTDLGIIKSATGSTVNVTVKYK